MSTLTATASYAEAERALWHHHGLAPADHRVELPTVGTRVRVQEVGSGEPVLLLHGSPTAGTTFAPLVAALDRFRCLVPDIPPGGLSGPFPVTPATLGLLLDHLVSDLLDALGVARAHLVGSSSGSAFALRAGHRAPDRIGRVVHLGAPGLVARVPPRANEKILLVPGMARLLARLTPGRRAQRAMLTSIGHGETIAAGRIPDAYWDWNDALYRRTDTFRAQVGMLTALRGRGLSYREDVVVGDDTLAAQGRTLVVWGSEDALATPAEAAAFAAAMPDARLELLRRAGHLPWLDPPPGVADSIARVLEA